MKNNAHWERKSQGKKIIIFEFNEEAERGKKEVFRLRRHLKKTEQKLHWTCEIGNPRRSKEEETRLLSKDRYKNIEKASILK